MSTPLVSVVIPAYNRADYTLLAVKSVINQGWSNLECIVVDDGSTDNTSELLDPLKGWAIKYHRQINQGVSAARNTGIELSEGDYIGFLDCDDIYIPGKIHCSIEMMNRYGYDMMYNSAILMNEKGDPIGVYKPKRHNLLFRNSIMNSVIIRRKVFDKVGMFDTDLFICADWDMWLRIEEHFRIGNINFPLSAYRI
jgi:glycosyltransferase involved in cell wall biosynthesis